MFWIEARSRDLTISSVFNTVSGMPNGYITTADAARQIRAFGSIYPELCNVGAIRGAKQFGAAGMIPASFNWAPQKPGPKPKVDRGKNGR